MIRPEIEIFGVVDIVTTSTTTKTTEREITLPDVEPEF